MKNLFRVKATVNEGNFNVCISQAIVGNDPHRTVKGWDELSKVDFPTDLTIEEFRGMLISHLPATAQICSSGLHRVRVNNTNVKGFQGVMNLYASVTA